jgi:hypothetical protein
MTVLMIQNYWVSAQHTETIPYSKFEELLKAGIAVKDVAISHDTITGTVKESGKGAEAALLRCSRRWRSSPMTRSPVFRRLPRQPRACRPRSRLQ